MSFTLTRIQYSIKSLDDLIEQNRIEYAPLANTSESAFFERMANIEAKLFDAWKTMAATAPSPSERTKYIVHEYPFGNIFTKAWKAIKQTGMPANFAEAIKRVRTGKFALLAQTYVVKYHAMVNCDLVQIGEDFSKKPLAFGVRQGSPLKNQLNRMYEHVVVMHKICR